MGGLRFEGTSFFVAGRFERLPKSRVERELASRVANLRRADVSLEMVLIAATELRRRRRSGGAHDLTRLDIAPSGELMMRIGDVLAELDGQMRFAWVQPPPDPDALFEAAEEAESSGALLLAEPLYYPCLTPSPPPPSLPFTSRHLLPDP